MRVTAIAAMLLALTGCREATTSAPADAAADGATDASAATSPSCVVFDGRPVLCPDGLVPSCPPNTTGIVEGAFCVMGEPRCVRSGAVTSNPVTCDSPPFDGGGQPTVCVLHVAQYPDGSANAEFTTRNNGTVCHLALDGLSLVDACTFTTMPGPTNTNWPTFSQVGMHTAVLTIVEGPGGPAECSATYTVLPGR